MQGCFLPTVAVLAPLAIFGLNVFFIFLRKTIINRFAFANGVLTPAQTTFQIPPLREDFFMQGCFLPTVMVLALLAIFGLNVYR